MSVLIGMHWSETKSGRLGYTLHLQEEFSQYYSDESSGRGCIGKACETVYVGDYDCSHLTIGTEIEINYGRAITTPKGTFQPIKSIDVKE